MRIKVQLSATPRLLATDAGDHLGPYAIVQTVPGGEHVILDAPDWSDEQLDALVRDWQRQGLVVDDGNGLWRHERTDYVPLGFVAPSGWYQVGDGPRMPVGPTFAPGDTFPLLGITEDIRRRGKYGSGVLLGLCDTGLAGDHPWFAGKSLEGDLTDSHGHGTHVAGTMAGAQGIASDAAIYSQNVLPGGQGTESGVAAGIRRCADRGCHVLNLSLGGSRSSVISDAVRYAEGRGVVVVAASGNEAAASIGSPADAADLIVMAHTRDREWASFTSGRQWSNGNRLGCPGVGIVSAVPGGGTRPMDGSSMAAPHCTGAVALLIGAGR